MPYRLGLIRKLTYINDIILIQKFIILILIFIILIHVKLILLINNAKLII